jgi:hypothetical protein
LLGGRAKNKMGLRASAEAWGRVASCMARKPAALMALVMSAAAPDVMRALATPLPGAVLTPELLLSCLRFSCSSSRQMMSAAARSAIVPASGREWE